MKSFSELFRNIAICISAISCSYFAEAENRIIEADYLMPFQEKPKVYFRCIGAGRAAEGLRADWQAQLRQIQEDMPFEYIRFHGILHDDMGVCTVNEVPEENDSIRYNFQYIDELYDFLLSVNIRPYVELSFMPWCLASSDKKLFWWNANVSTPSDYGQWEKLITTFIGHLTDRYGREEVRQWYFEVWNEPNHNSFFSGDIVDYFRLYDITARAIKSIDCRYRIGGPASAGNGWIKEIMSHCEENNVPLDFISTHTYGVKGAFDEFGKMQLALVPDTDAIPRAVSRVRKIINQSGGQDLELHYTEWSPSYSPRDLVHDSYLAAPYILNVLRKSDMNADIMSYWTFTDIFEEPGPPEVPFHGGFGIMNMQGLRKPAYFAYRYLSRLGQTELENNDRQSWVCKDDTGGIQVLLYDITMPEYKENGYNNRHFSVEQISSELPPVEIRLKNVPEGDYYVRIFRTGYLSNDIQSIYYRMGSPENLSRDQKDMLEKISSDVPEYSGICRIGRDGIFRKPVGMRQNDICLLLMERIQ